LNRLDNSSLCAARCVAVRAKIAKDSQYAIGFDLNLLSGFQFLLNRRELAENTQKSASQVDELGKQAKLCCLYLEEIWRYSY
jgi:hypothetical protein